MFFGVFLFFLRVLSGFVQLFCSFVGRNALLRDLTKPPSQVDPEKLLAMRREIEERVRPGRLLLSFFLGPYIRY